MYLTQLLEFVFPLHDARDTFLVSFRVLFVFAFRYITKQTASGPRKTGINRRTGQPYAAKKSNWKSNTITASKKNNLAQTVKLTYLLTDLTG